MASRPLLRRIAARPVTWAFAFAVSAVCYACSSTTSQGGARGAEALAGLDPSLFQPQVTNEAYPTDGVPCHDGAMQACAAYVDSEARAVDDLRAMRRSPEPADVALGIAALDVPSAKVTLEAIKLLGPYAENPDVEAKLLPLLSDTHAALQMEAARALERSSKAGPVLEMWKVGHRSYDVDPRDHDPDRDPTRWGWAWYDGAAAYPPGDGPSSLGMQTADAPDRVAAHYEKALGAKVVDYPSFQVAAQGLMTRLMTSAGSDPKALARVERGAPMNWPIPQDERKESARFFVIADAARPDQPDRFGVAYREPLYDTTVVVLAWDVSAYARVPRIARPMSTDL